jgi:thiamine-phosphate diphosphorylase
MMMLVTDRRRLSPGASDNEAADRLVELVEAAAAAEVEFIQIREKDLDTRPLASLVRRCVAAASGSKTQVLVNERADVALAAGADGVHLRADSIDASAVRSLPIALIGRSVHAVNDAEREREHLDYLVFGTLFPTSSKPSGHPLVSIAELSALCAASAIPVFAIGGITVERAGAAARAGAAGIAAIGVFIPPPGESVWTHLPSVTAELRRSFDTCGAVS